MVKLTISILELYFVYLSCMKRDYKILLYEVRVKQGLTLKQMEKLTGISKTTLNEIENDNRSPTLETLVQVAKALNIRVTDLFESEYK